MCGGYKIGGGWQVQFYPYKMGKGEAEKVLAVLKGGGGTNKIEAVLS